MDLFHETRQKNLDRAAPLAVRMRPRTLEEFVGQEHFLGPGKLLRRMLEADRVNSVIFYGPPGTGKTTLAKLIANYSKSHFEQLNAAGAGVKEVRAILDTAREKLGTTGGRTVLFLDEIHRFNRAQQDILLPDVEAGQIVLIGATTENPFFAVNAPLVSRSQIFQFAALSEDEIRSLVLRAISDKERGFGNLSITIDAAALDLWATMSDGDGRRALTALEVAVLSQMEQGRGEEGTEGRREQSRGQGTKGRRDEGTEGNPRSGRTEGPPPSAPETRNSKPETHAQTEGPPPSAPDTRNSKPETHSPSAPETRNPKPETLKISLDIAEQSMQRKAIVYDGTGDEHYDAASALIKSMRGSDPDAAIYWVARMLEAGEDPRFIARRIAILASEDIGNADPNALSVAAAAYAVVERIGMPECQLTLAQAAIYMATAPKSNASAMAIWSAMKDVREGRTIPVPKHLRDTHYKGSARLGHGSDYKYAHDFPGGFVGQDYLGVDKTYYQPTDRGYEQEIADRLATWKKAAGDSSAGIPNEENSR